MGDWLLWVVIAFAVALVGAHVLIDWFIETIDEVQTEGERRSVRDWKGDR